MAPPKQVVFVSVTVVNEDGEILLFRNKQNGWNVPTGLLRENESMRSAAMREVKEKSGVIVELSRFCGVFQNVRARMSHMMFLGKALGGDINIGDKDGDGDGKILDAGYFPLRVAMRLISWKIYKHRILYSLDHDKHPFFIDF